MSENESFSFSYHNKFSAKKRKKMERKADVQSFEIMLHEKVTEVCCLCKSEFRKFSDFRKLLIFVNVLCMKSLINFSFKSFANIEKLVEIL